MGKQGTRQSTATRKEKDSPYPSRYGSHESMVVENNEGDAWIACKDDKGPYVTSRTHLESGLMDPYRLTTLKFRRDMVKKHFPHLIEEYDV